MITLHNKMQQKFNVRENSREVTDTAPCLCVSVQFHFTTYHEKKYELLAKTIGAGQFCHMVDQYVGYTEQQNCAVQ